MVSFGLPAMSDLQSEIRTHIGGAVETRTAHTRSTTPVVFGRNAGWLHAPDGDVHAAVVICPSWEREALDSHRAFRVLADQLATDGIAALRFYYPGTGNSGDLVEEDFWQSCCDSAVQAGEYITAQTGCDRVVFAGFRVGSLIAAVAAARSKSVAGLLLIAPVLRGRSYLKQLEIQARLMAGKPVASNDGLTIGTLTLSVEAVRGMQAADMARLPLDAPLDVAVFSSGPNTAFADFAEICQERGIALFDGGFNGLEPLLTENMLQDKGPDFTALRRWLLKSLAADRPEDRPMKGRPPKQAAYALHSDCWREEAFFFGRMQNLYGVLCRPAKAESRLGVIIVNAGLDPGFGAWGLGARLARHLAESGIGSLRFDFAGVGDSIPETGDAEALSSAFLQDRVPDIRTAVDELHTFGYYQIAIVGLCSGAYHALRGIYADPRIVRAALVNIPAFEWSSNADLDVLWHQTASTSHYLKLVASREFWKRLLTGQIKLSNTIAGRTRRSLPSAGATAQKLSDILGLGFSLTISHRLLEALRQRKARTCFISSSGDNSIPVVESDFGRKGRHLSHYHSSMIIVPDADHMFSRKATQTALIEHITSHVSNV